MAKVYPVNKNGFKVKDAETFVGIAELESIECSVDSGVETWYSMEQGGHQSALKTSQAISFSCSGKRAYGDAGNDLIYSKAFLVGEEANAEFEWTKPDGEKIVFTAVVGVETLAGASTDVDALEFSLTVIGAPTITPAP